MGNNSEEIRRKLEKMETELNNAASNVADKMESQGNNSVLTSLAKGFDKLATVAKVGTIAVVLMVSLALLSIVFKIVMSAVIAAVLLGIAYIGYKFFLTGE